MKRTLCGLILLLVVGTDTTARSDEITELRLAAYLPAVSTAVREVIEPWVKVVEQETAGAIRFKRFYGGSLGRGPHRQYLITEQGISDLSFVFLAMHPGRFPELEIVDLPLLMKSGEQASSIAWQLYEEGLASGFEKVHLIGLWTTSPSQIFLRPKVATLDDLYGLKIRVTGPLQGTFISQFGATPEILDAVSVSDALRRDTVNGLFQGWTGVVTFHQQSLVDWHYDLPAGMLGFALIMNKDRWRSLSPNKQAIFNDVSGAEFSRQGGRAYDRIAVTLRERLRTTGRSA